MSQTPETFTADNGPLCVACGKCKTILENVTPESEIVEIYAWCCPQCFSHNGEYRTKFDATEDASRLQLRAANANDFDAAVLCEQKIAANLRDGYRKAQAERDQFERLSREYRDTIEFWENARETPSAQNQLLARMAELEDCQYPETYRDMREAVDAAVKELDTTAARQKSQFHAHFESQVREVEAERDAATARATEAEKDRDAAELKCDQVQRDARNIQRERDALKAELAEIRKPVSDAEVDRVINRAQHLIEGEEANDIVSCIRRLHAEKVAGEKAFSTAVSHLREVYSQIGNHARPERRHAVTPGCRDAIRDFLKATAALAPTEAAGGKGEG